MIHITAPTTDKTSATNANGSPSRNPNGLQSPISLAFFFSVSDGTWKLEFGSELRIRYGHLYLYFPHGEGTRSQPPPTTTNFAGWIPFATLGEGERSRGILGKLGNFEASCQPVEDSALTFLWFWSVDLIHLSQSRRLSDSTAVQFQTRPFRNSVSLHPVRVFINPSTY